MAISSNDQALGRYDGQVFVSLPNARAALETQPEGDRLDYVIWLGGRQGRRKFTLGALGQRRFTTITSPSQMFDDPPGGDRGHDLVRVPDARSTAVAQRKGNGVGEVARLRWRQVVDGIGHRRTIGHCVEQNKNKLGRTSAVNSNL
jgi:hypothetical protein